MAPQQRQRAVLVLCARQPTDSDLEGLGEIREIQEALAQYQQRDRNSAFRYVLRICTSMEQVRDYVRRVRAPIDLDDEDADEPSLPITGYA